MNKPQALIAFQEKAAEKIGSLQLRELVLLCAAGVVIVSLLVFTVFNMKFQKIESQIAQTEGYRKALNYIADNQGMYKVNRAKKEATRQRLLNADTKVVNKLTTMASSLGFDVTVVPKDPHKTSDESGAEEQEIEVEMRNVEYGKYLEYLIQIHKLDTPVYMWHLKMKRSGSLSDSATKMSGTITLMSYRLKEQNAT